MAAVEGALVDTSALTRARHPAVAQELKALRNDGKLWTCDIVTLELGYSARSLVEWQAVQTVQRLLPTAAISASVTRRAQEVQGRLAASGHHRLPLPDLVVAAAAEAAQLEILHYDRDYDTIGRVTGQPARWIARAGTLD